MAPRSLAAMCTRVAILNVQLLPCLTDLPMNAVSEILSSVRSAKHLRALELADEELADITAQHWKRLIGEDFSHLVKRFNWAPTSPRDWHRVYEKYETHQEDSVAAAIELFKERMEASKRETASHAAQIISFREAKRTMPGVIKTALAGTAEGGRGGGGGGGGRGGWGRSAGGGGSGGSGGVRKPPTSQPLSWAKREARQSALRLRGPRSAAPVDSKLTEAPQAMIKQKIIERQFDPVAAANGAPQIRPPRKRRAAVPMTPEQQQREKELKERERRLLDIKKRDAIVLTATGHAAGDDADANKSKKAPAVTLLTFSDDDEPGNDDKGSSSSTKKSPTRGSGTAAPTPTPTPSPRKPSGGLLSNRYSPFKGAPIMMSVPVPKRPATTTTTCTSTSISPPPAKTAARSPPPRPTSAAAAAAATSPPAAPVQNGTTTRGLAAPQKRKAPPNIFMGPGRPKKRAY